MTRHCNLYLLQGKTVIGNVAIVRECIESDDTKLWHMSLEHAGEKALQGLLKGAKICKLDLFEHCVLGKQTRVKFSTVIHQTKCILDYVHSDVLGPTKIDSMSGKHWIVIFIDDYSKRSCVYTKMRCWVCSSIGEK